MFLRILNVCRSIILTVILICGTLFAQSNSKNLNETSDTVMVSKLPNGENLNLSINEVDDTSNIYGLFKYLRKNGILDDAFSNKGMPDAILFFNGLKNKNEWILLDDKFQRLNKLYYANSLLVIILDNNKSHDYQIEINVAKHESYLIKELKALPNVFLALFEQKKRRGEIPESYVYSYLFNNIGPAPSDISLGINELDSFSLEQMREKGLTVSGLGKFANIVAISNSTVYFKVNNTIKISNLERRYIGFSIGASYHSSNEKIIAPDPNFNDLNVLKVSNGLSKTWKGSAIILITFMPGISSDFSPTDLPWKRNFWEDFWQRFNFNVGFDINDHPFDRLYIGLGFQVNSITNLILGVSYTNDYKEGTTFSLLKVSSLTDLGSILPRKYESGMFFGLALRISDALGSL